MIKKRIVIFFATAGYIGYSPVIPGTIGTLPAMAIAYLISLMQPIVGGLIILIITAVSVYLASEGEKILGGKDPKNIVCDEVAGFLVASFLMPFTLMNVTLVFILFRIFDILKPFPIGLIDSRIKGGFGIVLDDVAAGIYANIAALLMIKIII